MDADAQESSSADAARESPRKHQSRSSIAPALPSIAYRVGAYPTFFASMEAALSSSSYPALAGLRTRDRGDFSIALVDAWAEVLDILTFYTERLANEAYLGTAIEGRSVFELARLVGYKPSPGVSASTVLAFTLATAPGSPAIVPLAAGARVQSVPGPGQSPQVFETAAALTATIANNAIPAATSMPWQLNGGETWTWIAGTSNNIQPGNVLLFISATSGTPSTSDPAAVVYVTAVTIDPVYGNTMVSWDQPLPTSFKNGAPSTVFLYIFRTKAALYGANAPSPGLFAKPSTIPGYGSPDWDWQQNASYSNVINLDNAYPGLNPFGGASPTASQLQWLVLTGPQPTSGQYTSFFQIQNASESNPALYALSAKTTRLVLASSAVLPGGGDTALGLDELLYEFVKETRSTTAYVGSQLLTFANLPLTAPTLSTKPLYPYPLATGMIVPTFAETITLATLQTISDNAPIGVSGKRVRIASTVALTGTAASGTTNGGFTPAGATGALPVSINQPFLIDAFPPGSDPVSGNQLWSVITVTGQPGTLSAPGLIAPTVALTGTGNGASNGGFTPSGASAAQPVVINQPFLIDASAPTDDPGISGNQLWSVLTIAGQAGILSLPKTSLQLMPSVQLLPSVTADPLAGESAVVAVATVMGATTKLTLAAPLQRLYDTPTLNVNANAVQASHGETMREVVGSGDAANAALQFQLKQSPLTYTSASTAGGVQSTLQVRINNLLWNEVPNFLASAPSDRVFVTRPSPTGGPFMQFGDGVTGSRTPTGTSNIQAQYRKGIGIAGMVAAGQLTQPLDRPQGLQYVTNPGPATGGADPASPSDAQRSAPLPTLTLGRVVSLEDYQNFALGFAGISMALATWTWFGSITGIFLTLAGEGGAQLNATDQIVQNLMQAYQNYGLPNVPVLPVSYVPQNFEIGMQVLVNAPTYDPAAVIPQVWQALTAAFAFGRLAPGQSVSASQIIQIAQQVPGVTAVNLTALNLSGAVSGQPASILCASGPVPGNASGTITASGAQVLLLDPASVGNVGVWS